MRADVDLLAKDDAGVKIVENDGGPGVSLDQRFLDGRNARGGAGGCQITQASRRKMRLPPLRDTFRPIMSIGTIYATGDFFQSAVSQAADSFALTPASHSVLNRARKPE
jgi:hypothetical protein